MKLNFLIVLAQIIAVQTLGQGNEQAVIDVAWELRNSNAQKAIKLLDSLLYDSVQLDMAQNATAHNIRGICYSRLGIADSALMDLHKAFELRSLLGDERGMASTLNNLGRLNIGLHDVSEAVENFSLAVNLANRLGDSLLQARTLMNLSVANSLSGSTQKAVQVLDSASKYLPAKQEDTRADILFNKGRLQEKYGDRQNAFNSYESCLLVYQKIGDLDGVGEVNYNLGSVSIDMERFEAAEKYLKKACEIFDSTGNLQMLTNTRSRLIDLAFLSRHDSAGFEDFRRMLDIKDSLSERQALDRYQSLFVQYETEKKERENTELRASNAELDASKKQQKMWIAGLAMGIAILLVGGILVIFYQRQRALLARKNEQIKQQKIDELIQRQELASLDAMLEGQEKERKRIAEDLHDRIGSQLAAVKLNMEALEGKVDQGQTENQAQFSRTYGMLDHLVDEVRKLSHDMVSGVLMKFGLEEAVRELAGRISASGKMKVNVSAHNLDERVSSKVEIAVYRMVQELLANVLKHARANEITISLTRQNGNLNVLVEDNGLGFDAAKVKKGMGLDNVKQRAATLNGSAMIDSKTGRGTTVILDIPLL